MDRKTSKILKRLALHQKVKKILIFISYFSIIFGIATYVFYGLSKDNRKFKLVSDFKKNPKDFNSEKIMINPEIRFRYNDNQIYEIKAKRARHNNQEEVTLFDVLAVGEIGNITAGQLEIDQSGNHLVFTQNPILILNNDQKDKK